MTVRSDDPTDDPSGRGSPVSFVDFRLGTCVSALFTGHYTTQLPSGDTSGEGDTAGTGGQGDQATNPPPQDGAPASSQARSAPEADDAEADEEMDDPGEHPGDALILPKVRTVVSTESAGMHALGAMACQFLTEQTANRLEAKKQLPPPDWDAQGNVRTPSRHDFSADPSSLVGAQDHRLQGFHTRDGYGGLEALLQV
ncbi:hypothetical protein PF008_g23395 [Phytophthora fragariae]|uniref:Uncharacterized protein n=1 Tax=Phytophthora fragariae TaxID=53985 RepID=A0A6G0QRU6_9STRA|nr:hypothetical protein PF008_g23395 [Phytophthora fragariae]